MNADFKNADSRTLHEPFAKILGANNPRAALEWLVHVLATQSPSLRSSNSYLVAYTGCSDGINWLEATVDSPVTTHWGEAAALLGAPWPRIKNWLVAGRPRQLMALDTLLSYRAPAPNMSPLAQIAAPVLPDVPTLGEFEATLSDVLDGECTLRIRKSVERIQALAAEILLRKDRGVSVADLPLLFIEPHAFPGASDILSRHEAVISGMRESFQSVLPQVPPRS